MITAAITPMSFTPNNIRVTIKLTLSLASGINARIASLRKNSKNKIKSSSIKSKNAKKKNPENKLRLNFFIYQSPLKNVSQITHDLNTQ